MTSFAKIHRFGKMLAGFAVIAAAVALFAPAPNAGSEHFAVVNNDIFMGLNSATVMKAAGTKLNPLLDVVKTLQTGIVNWGGAIPDVVVARDGADICVFIADAEESGNAISSFRYPGMSLVDTYNDPAVPADKIGTGIGLAVRGNVLFAAYSEDMNGMPDSYIGVWTMQPGCVLTLLNTTYIQDDEISSMAATPGGKALLVSYGGVPIVDSLSVNADGSITEHGPYNILDIGLTAAGIDITADGKYGLFSIQGDTFYNYTQVAIFPINADGSLGNYYNIGGDGSLGPGEDEGYLRLSPDERFLYSDNAGMTTLNFSENPLNLTYSGCFTKLRVPQGQRELAIGGLATATPSSAGGAVYIAEATESSAYVALLGINPSTGCTTEANQSPFLNPVIAPAYSLASWPLRPF